MISNVIKVKLEERVKERNTTLFAVAKATGVSYNTLFNIKEGKTNSISFDVLEKLCVQLQCTPNDLLKIEN